MEFDFSKNMELDADGFAKVPANFQSAYEEKDGKYVIAESTKGMVEAIVGLTGALGKERATNKELGKKPDALALLKQHLDFDDFDTAKAKFDELASAVAEGSKVDPAKIKAEIQKTFDTQLADKDKQLGTMQSTLEKYMVDAAAVEAIASAKGNSTLLMPLVRDKVKLVKDGDEYVVRVADESGDYRGDGKGGFMQVADLIGEMKASKEFGVAFESEARPGTGQQQGVRQQSQQTPGTINREDMTPTQMLQAGLEARKA